MRVRHLALAVALSLASCQRDHYVLRLQPEEGSLRRQLECWRTLVRPGDVPAELDPFDLERLQAIADEYEVPLPAAAHAPVRHRFEGVFRRMPADLRSFGRYDVRRTTLGSLHTYAERFGGDADAQAILDRRQRAADVVVDVLSEWFELEMASEPRREAIERFLRGRFRADVLNVAGILSPRGPFALFDHEVRARLHLYFLEHGYDDGIADLLDPVGGAEVDPEPLRRRLAREMGVGETEPVPASLAFLSKDRVLASWSQFSRGSRVLAGLPGRRGGAPAFPDFVATEVLGGEAPPPARFRVDLACEVEPIVTNGAWSEDDRLVRWEWSDLPGPGSTSRICHAHWAVPDGRAQKGRFGRMALRGAALRSYVEWRTGLDAERGAEWDRFVDLLEPATVTPGHLHAFVPTDGGEWPKTGTSLLAKALE